MKYLLAALLFLPSLVMGGQLSYMESSLTNTTAHYYQNRDRRIEYQYDLSGDKYVALQYRVMQNCPYYCGVPYEAVGLGLGKKWKNNLGKFYVKGGYYWIKNGVGNVKNEENIYYYLTRKFGNQSFVAYEVKNKNAVELTLGQEIELGENYGVKVEYQHMKFKEVLIGYIQKNGDHPLWWEPNVRDMSNIGVGFYYNF